MRSAECGMNSQNVIETKSFGFAISFDSLSNDINEIISILVAITKNSK